MEPLPEDIEPRDVEQWLSRAVFYAKRQSEGYPHKDSSPVGSFALAKFLGMPGHGSLNARFYEDGWVEEVPLHDIRIHWPKCGAINVDYGERGPRPLRLALYVQRRQARQYRRTFYPNITRAEIPCSIRVQKQLGTIHQPQVSDYRVLRAIFDPWYPSSVEEAKALLDDREWASIALSPSVVMVGADDPKVYYRGELVGQLLSVNPWNFVLYDEEMGQRAESLMAKLVGTEGHSLLRESGSHV